MHTLASRFARVAALEILPETNKLIAKLGNMVGTQVKNFQIFFILQMNSDATQDCVGRMSYFNNRDLG